MFMDGVRKETDEKKLKLVENMGNEKPIPLELNISEKKQ